MLVLVKIFEIIIVISLTFPRHNIGYVLHLEQTEFFCDLSYKH